MFVNNNVCRTNLFRYGSQKTQGTNTYDSWTNAAGSRGASGNKKMDAAKSAAAKKRMLSRDGRDSQGMTGGRSIVEESFSYAESLRANRANRKKTSQKLKKLRYSYKSISSQLLRSKTSVDAAKVFRKARRELIRLKGKRLHENGRYDSYELEAAITHAQAMVRVARKKVKHLEEEELVKVKGGPCAGGLEEQKEEENELSEEEQAVLEQLAYGNGAESETGGNFVSQEDVLRAKQEWMQTFEEEMRKAETREEMQQRMEQMQRAREMSESMQDLVEELSDEMSDSMRDLLEELGFSELSEGTSRVEVDMDPEDYEQMKRKHRLEEMKAIAQADAEYLRAVFNKLEREKQSSASGIPGADSNSVSPGAPSGGMVIAANTGGAAPGQVVDMVSAPDAVAAAAAAPVEGGRVDVSV